MTITPRNNELKKRIFNIFIVLSLPFTVLLTIAYKDLIIACASWFPMENVRPAIALLQLALAYSAFCWMTVKLCLVVQKRMSKGGRSEIETKCFPGKSVKDRNTDLR